MKQTKKILLALLLALGTLALSFFLKGTEILDAIQNKLSYELYHERELRDDIVIIAVDSESFASIEDGGLGPLNSWDNGYFAKVLDFISDSHAKVIVLDFIFSAYDSKKSGDLALVDSLSRNSYIFLSDSITGPFELDHGVVHYESTHSSLEPYMEKAQAAFGNLSFSEDQASTESITGLPLLFNREDQIEAHLVFQVAQVVDPSLKIEDIPLEDGFMLLNYSGLSYSYTMVSFVDVYFGRIPKDFFEGKIVLIGATSSILSDNWSTPIDEDTLMPGIEIQANAIQMILDRNFLVYQENGDFLWSSGFVLLILSLAGFLLRMRYAGPVYIGMMILFPFYAQWRFDQGVIIDLVWLPVGIILCAGITLLYLNATEFKEKRRLRSAFSRYVSPELVDEIVNKPNLLHLGGERRELTALFLDIENFTTLSESLEPEAVISILNTYFGAFTELILAHGGMVDKFQGDAIMALFGAPLKTVDHAEKACQTALELLKKLEELNQKMGRQLKIRVGIATGPVVLGNMGSETRFDYTALGDTVNTASRLEGINKQFGTQIAVNLACKLACEGKFEFKLLGKLQLKGKTQDTEIHELVSTML